MKRYEPHPLAAAVPGMSAEDYAELKTSIATHGLREPIVLFEGKILDGIHRERACFETKQPLRTREWSEKTDGTPEVFVRDSAVARRHFTVGQRASFAVEFAEVLRERYPSKHGADAHGDRGDLEVITKCLGIKALKIKPERVVELTARVVGGGVGMQSIERMITLRKHAAKLYREVTLGELEVAVAYRTFTAAKSPRQTLGTAKKAIQTAQQCTKRVAALTPLVKKSLGSLSPEARAFVIHNCLDPMIEALTTLKRDLR